MRLAVFLYFWLISTQGDMGPVGPQGLMGIPGIGSQGEQVIDAFSLSLSCRTFWPKPGVHWRPVRQTAISTFDSGIAMLLVQRVKRLLQCRRPGFHPWVGKIPWRRKWQPTPVLLPRKSHGWRSLGQATVHGVTKSQTRLSDFTFTFTFIQTGM